MTDGGAFFDYAADNGGGEGLVVGDVGKVEGERRDGEVRRERGDDRVGVRVLAVVVFYQRV